MEPTQISTAVLLKHGLMALFGGVANAIHKHRTGESKGWADFMILAVMSSFFGLVFGLLALHFFPLDEYLTYATSGIGGWLGIESSGILVGIIKKLLPGDK